MSKWYEIWSDDEKTSYGLVLSSGHGEAHKKLLAEEFNESLRFSFRASSWRRAKRRYRAWLAYNGYNR